MTIVIPYKSEVHNGLELKYALRSIEKNLSGWKHVILIGEDKPEFLKSAYVNKDGIFDNYGEETWFIYQRDYAGRKEYSVYNKLLTASNWDEQISENFLYYNDDHFLLKPLDVSEMKYWHNGPLEGRNVYNRELAKMQNTIVLLGAAHSASFLNYDIHTPIIFNKEIFKRIFKNRMEELCIKSYYTNHTSNESEFMEDCKIVGMFSKEEVKQKIAGRLFFSTNAICSPTVEVLEELFPDKSKFEL